MATILSSAALVLVALYLAGPVPLGLPDSTAWAAVVLTVLLQGVLVGTNSGSRG